MIFSMAKMPAKIRKKYFFAFLSTVSLAFFLLLYLSVSPFLHIALINSVHKTAENFTFRVSCPKISAAECLRSVSALPQTDRAYIRQSVPVSAAARNRVLDIKASSLVPGQDGTIEITAGKYPKKQNEILISRAVSRIFKIYPGDTLMLFPARGPKHHAQKMSVSGIYTRSPLAARPREAEILTTQIPLLRPHISRAAESSSAYAVVVHAKNTVAGETLKTKIRALGGTDITTASQYRARLFSAQHGTQAYLKSSLHWILALPLMLSLFSVILAYCCLQRNSFRFPQQMLLLGARRTQVVQIEMARAFLCTFAGTALGIALARGFEQALFSLISSLPGGSFIISAGRPRPGMLSGYDYPTAALLCTLCGTGIAFAVLSVSVLKCFSSHRLFYLRPLPQGTESPAREPRIPALAAINISGTLLFAVFIYYALIICENLLFVASPENTADSLTLIGMLAAVFLTAVTLFSALVYLHPKKFPRRQTPGPKLPRSFLRHLRVTETHFFRIHFGAILIIGLTAAVFALETFISVSGHGAREPEYRPFSYDVLIQSAQGKGKIGPRILKSVAADPDISGILSVSAAAAAPDFSAGAAGREFYIHTIHPADLGKAAGGHLPDKILVQFTEKARTNPARTVQNLKRRLPAGISPEFILTAENTPTGINNHLVTLLTLTVLCAVLEISLIYTAAVLGAHCRLSRYEIMTLQLCGLTPRRLRRKIRSRVVRTALIPVVFGLAAGIFSGIILARYFTDAYRHSWFWILPWKWVFAVLFLSALTVNICVTFYLRKIRPADPAVQEEL